MSPASGAANLSTAVFSGPAGPPSHSAAERFALDILSMPEVSAADVVKLSYLLPRDSSLRPSSGTDSFLFSSGAYAFGGGIAGLFANSKLFPQTSLVLTRFAKQVLGSAFCFSSCVLMRDNLTKPHRDINNVGQSALIRCSPFEGGELWIESSGGPLKSGGRSGQVHPFDKYVIFDPSLYHSTQPWTNGPRVVLAAYTVRNLPKLSAADRSPSGSPSAVPDPKPVPKDAPSPCAEVGRPALALELCAGSAQLTRCLLDSGFAALAFDRRRRPSAGSRQ